MKNQIICMKKNHLNHKVASFAVKKHAHIPFCFSSNLVSYCRETDLISRSEAINFIEPKASK